MILEVNKKARSLITFLMTAPTEIHFRIFTSLAEGNFILRNKTPSPAFRSACTKFFTEPRLISNGGKMIFSGETNGSIFLTKHESDS